MTGMIKQELWRGSKFKVCKEPGGKVWGGRGSRGYVPVAYVIVDMSRGGSDGKPVKRVQGRQTQAQLRTLIAEAEAMDANARELSHGG